MSPVDQVPEAARAQVRVIRTVQELEAFIPEWYEFLASGAAKHSVYQTPAYVCSMLATSAKDEPCVVVVSDSSGIHCVAPCFVKTSPLRIRLSVITLVSLPLRTIWVFDDRFVVARDTDPRRCVDLVFRALSGIRSTHLIRLTNVERHSEIWTFFEGGRRPRFGYRLVPLSQKPEPSHRLRFGTTYEQYLSKLGSKARRSLRVRGERLSAAFGGTVDVVKVSRPDQVEFFLEHVDTVFRRSWQAATFGYTPRASPETVARLTDFAVRGWLRSYLLMTQAGPIAYGVGFQYQGTFYWDETAYAQECSGLAPGSVLTHRVIADLFLHDTPELLDFGAGDGEYKRTFGNEQIETCSVHLVKTLAAAGVTNLQLAMNRSESCVRKLLVQLRLTEYVRRLLKRRNMASPATMGATAGVS
jgi:CelD/BcsL family acetyltransferase involved in cellulose biosynthesis